MKLGVLMVKEMVVVAFWLPEIPVIVSVAVPGTAELLAVRVSVLLPVVGFGEKEAVTPLGRPEMEKFTLPVNPYAGST